MVGLKGAAISAGLETLYFSGAHRLARPVVGGLGAILTFHHVVPPRNDPFQPNRGLEVSPAFLNQAIASLVSAGIDIVSIDEALRRLREGSKRRFVVLTFDDGYRDVATFARPILERHRVPFVLYIASAFADGEGELWWRTLEEAVVKGEPIVVTLDGVERAFDCATPRARSETYRTIYRWLRQREREADLRAAVREIAARAGIDMRERCGRTCMGWDALRELAAHPLVTIGAHTVDHVMLAKVPAYEARAQMADGARRIEAMLGVTPRHFAYPVGDRSAAGTREFAIAAELGFESAVTTRPGVLFAEHARHLAALPRISVNGDFQRLRYLDVLLSGAATALWNGFARVNAA